MNIFEAIVLGAVQGLTEFLPVSSSGHLAIFQHFFGLNDNNLFFNVMLHIGTLTAVCAVYWRLFLRLIKSFFMILKKIFTGKFKWSEMDADENLVMMIIIGLLPLFLLFLPIGGGMKIKDLADKWNSDGYLIITSISLLVTSFLLVIGINANRKTTILYKSHGKLRADGAGRRKLNPVDAVFIGLFQAVAAIFPGISRSGSTLTAGELRKINKQRAHGHHQRQRGTNWRFHQLFLTLSVSLTPHRPMRIDMPPPHRLLKRSHFGRTVACTVPREKSPILINR